MSNNYKIKLFQDEAARCINELYKKGYLPNEKMGDVSVRDPESGYVFISLKPGTLPLRELSEYHGSDIAVVDKDGNPVTHHTIPSDNLALHLAVYKARPDVNCIIHTYPIWSSLFSERKEALPYVLVEQVEASTNVKCVESAPSMTKEYINEVVEKLGDQIYVLLYHFGSLSVGANVDHAINYLAWMESVARKITHASMIGELKYINNTVGQLVTEGFEYNTGTNYNVFNDYDQILFKEEVARGTRLLNLRGYSPSGESGDTSVRDLKTGLIYISGSPTWCFQRDLRDARGWERFVTDINETIYVPWSEPTCEWPMHVAIYRKRPDVGAIVHTHGEWASVFACIGMDVPLSIIGEGLTGVIPCAKFANAGTHEVANNTAEALVAADCCIMSNHGAVAVGRTMDEAMDKVAWMEQACQKAYYAILASGGVKADARKAIQKLSAE
ncbi:MAG: class II aldolase/adducin family protein [Firmicutes bacterium]|nr:class II aldolase/adducin family protein [Bacillota bacterium]